MNSRQRVLGAINRIACDRIPVKHEGTPEISQMIMEHFDLTNMEQLRPTFYITHCISCLDFNF